MSLVAEFQPGVDAYDRSDFETAYREWLPLAEQGHADAQYKLGLMYLRGNGVPEDKATTAKWFRLSAEQGFADAQAMLGWMYYKGDGIPQDYAEAVKWCRLAAMQGNVMGQAGLASMYISGQGVPQDFV